jgi:HK97 family phage major capsid protein
MDAELQVVAVKAYEADGKWRLEIRAIPFGGPNGGRDAHGEYFSERTNIHDDKYAPPPLVYYHGFGAGARKVYIGKSVSRFVKRTDGWWVTGELDPSIPEARRVWEAAKRSQAAVSSGSAPHLVVYGRDGEILEWPPVEISLWEPDSKKSKPANTYAIAIPATKAVYTQAGIEFPSEFDQAANELQGDATGEQQGGTEADSGKDYGDRKPVAAIKRGGAMDGEVTLTAEQVRQITLDAIKADRDAQALEAEQKRQEQERTAAAVKAALEQREREEAPLRRLGGGSGAPHVAAFADTRKFEGLDAGDLAFAIDVLNESKAKGQSRGPSNAALKALAIKVAEAKDEVGEQGRIAMKMIGLRPEHALDAVKANELDYSTQSGFGDEFVPTVTGTGIWELVRIAPMLLAQLPQQEFTGPGDTFPISVEGADPTFYKIGQATDLNATTGRPDATIGDSKIATANKSMTLGKIGTRVPYSGEMEEDSIVPWVPQVRRQTAKAFAEQGEHLLLDGDTATGATTNVNHIGGTPTSTGAKQDLFLTFDGPRKLALVTNTANSRSAGGSLVDSDFLETLKLMGSAGINALDRMQILFVLDLNTAWKAAQLLSAKTRDVFSNPTIEQGLLTGIWGYPVYNSAFMHFKSSVRKANTSGKVDQTTPSNNTTGSLLAIRKDQWLVGWKRRMVFKLQEIPDSDSYQLICTARLGLVYRDNEASAVSFNVGV